MAQKNPKVDSKFCRISNKPSLYYQRLLKMCHSGEISPSLVTLVVTARQEKECFYCKGAFFANEWLTLSLSLSLSLSLGLSKSKEGNENNFYIEVKNESRETR